MLSQFAFLYIWHLHADYSKSVSKPGSRSPSQNLSDTLHKTLVAGLSGDEDTGDVEGTHGGVFGTASRQSKTDPGKKSASREPSLDLVQPSSAQTDSCTNAEPNSTQGAEQDASAGVSHAVDGDAEQAAGDSGTAALSNQAEGFVSSDGDSASNSSGHLTKDKEASLGGAASLGELPDSIHLAPEPEDDQSAMAYSAVDKCAKGKAVTCAKRSSQGMWMDLCCVTGHVLAMFPASSQNVLPFSPQS